MDELILQCGSTDYLAHFPVCTMTEASQKEEDKKESICACSVLLVVVVET